MTQTRGHASVHIQLLPLRALLQAHDSWWGRLAASDLAILAKLTQTSAMGNPAETKKPAEVCVRQGPSMERVTECSLPWDCRRTHV